MNFPFQLASFRCLTLLTAVLAGTVSSQAANLFGNAGFETGVFGPWDTTGGSITIRHQRSSLVKNPISELSTPDSHLSTPPAPDFQLLPPPSVSISVDQWLKTF